MDINSYWQSILIGLFVFVCITGFILIPAGFKVRFESYKFVSTQTKVIYLFCIIISLAIVSFGLLKIQIDNAPSFTKGKKPPSHLDVNRQISSLSNLIIQLKLVLKKNPSSKGWFLLGEAYLSEHQYTKSLESFSHALNLSDGFSDKSYQRRIKDKIHILQNMIQKK